MLEKVKQFMLQHQLVPQNGRLLLAVSGGVDSVVMTDVLQKLAPSLGLTLFIAHLNHNLRGAYADRDQAFVKNLGASRGLVVCTQKTDINEYAAITKMCVEEAGRRARYEFLHEAATGQDCQYIALAHHMRDQCETMLLNLARGTGLQGLEAMRPLRHDGVVRPFLCVDKPEIEAYAKANKLDFVFDHTNDCLDLQRNRVRHVLLPEMETHFNPQIVKAMCRLTEIVADENAYANAAATDWLTQHAKAAQSSLAINIAALQSIPKALSRRVLRQAINQVKGNLRKIELTHIESILSLIQTTQNPKRLDLPDQILITKTGGVLQITQSAVPLRQLRI